MSGDAKARGEYLGGFCVRVGEDGRSLHFWNEDSDEERMARTCPSPCGDPGKHDFVVPRPTGPLQLSFLPLPVPFLPFL